MPRFVSVTSQAGLLVLVSLAPQLVFAQPSGRPGPAMASAAAPPANATPPAATPAATPTRTSAPMPSYRLGVGDVIAVNVWKEPDASVASLVVRSDGKISLPLIKELEVLGLTTAETESLIAKKLARFIHDPDVTVLIRESRARKAYVVGAVRREGPISLEPHMSVLQVLLEAGGVNEYAKRKKIYILRTENGQQHRFPFDYDAAIKGQRNDQNILIKPEDTIVVP